MHNFKNHLLTLSLSANKLNEGEREEDGLLMLVVVLCKVKIKYIDFVEHGSWFLFFAQIRNRNESQEKGILQGVEQ